MSRFSHLGKAELPFIDTIVGLDWITEREAIRQEETENDPTENGGENNDSQIVITFHLCRSLQQQQHTEKQWDKMERIRKIETQEHRSSLFAKLNSRALDTASRGDVPSSNLESMCPIPLTLRRCVLYHA